ncbi:MAG: methionine synthase [Armatimonadetes bacterium]|nr:methionine synthase [Armatimonadota bacterium]
MTQVKFEPPHLLPTTVVGSYSLPKWLEQARASHLKGELSDREIEEAQDNAVKSCIKDMELAGVDLITDGELRRETMIYFFNRNIRGFDLYGPEKAIGSKDVSVRMPDPVVRERVSRGDLPLISHWDFLRQHTSLATKVCVTGPHMLAKRASNEFYPSDKDLAFDLADILNGELRDLATAGCNFVQIDEAVWPGYPDELSAWGAELFERTVKGVDAKVTLHVCFGNYQRKVLFDGTYDNLFPALLESDTSQFVLEFARLGIEQLNLFRRFPTDRELGAGVIDVKTDEIETPELVADRIRKILEVFPPDRVYINPDCGLKFTRREIAFAKLKAMVDGAAIVRREVTGSEN